MKISMAIIGSGIAGLTSASLLKQSGHDVMYLKFPPKTFRVWTLLQPSGIALLKELKIADKIINAGSKIKRLVGHNDKKENTRPFL